MSPLLFAIAIEPLAIWLRSERGFEGITRLGTTHKVSLYADDLLLYISNPITSLPVIFNILEQFGAYSGYKLNYHKSELFPINSLSKQLPRSVAPFKWADNGFRYLGVFITDSISSMFSTNFRPLVEKIEEDFARWSALPLSLAGRINLIKMVVMPKFLYLFQHIPIYINKSFFDKIDGTISKFLWGNKPARIQKAILQSSKSDGGLALPNLRRYYWAANVQQILYWMDDSGDSLPVWAQVEKETSHLCLRSALCSQLPLPLLSLRANPVVSGSLKIWSQLRRSLGLQGSSILSPLLRNHAFTPSTMDPVFKIWKNKGIISIKDLYTDNIFSSFAELSSKFNLPGSHLFRFFQTRDFVKKNFPHFPNRPPETLMEALLTVNPKQRKCISVLYNLLRPITLEPLNLTRAAWESDLSIALTDKQWSSALSLVHTSSICARHGLLQCKILHRIHYTNAKLARIYPAVNDACNRCNQSPATHCHMFWSCPKLTTFWQNIFNTISGAYGQTVLPNPISAIFGSPSDIDLPAVVKRVLSFSTLLARRLILLDWKLPCPPSYNRWIRDVLYNLKLEKLRFSLNGSTKKFYNIWLPFLIFVDSPGVPLDADKD